MEKEKTANKKAEILENVNCKFICITICILALCLVFCANRKKETLIKFTESDVKIISELQKTYGGDIVVYKTNDGKLMISWDDE